MERIKWTLHLGLHTCIYYNIHKYCGYQYLDASLSLTSALETLFWNGTVSTSGNGKANKTCIT